MVDEKYITQHMKPINMNTGSCNPTFQDWLLERYGTTPITLRVLSKQTARFGSGRKEYESLMAWYRRRYWWEMEQRKQIIESNPFKEENEKWMESQTKLKS